MTSSKRSPDDFAAEMAALKQADGGLMNIGAAIDHDGLSQDNPSDIITAADEAADRLISGQSWRDWVAVGRAFQIGRTQAMAAAGTNRPEGRHYAAAISRWLSEHPKLDKLLGGNKHKALRCRLLDLIDHISEVEAWWAKLPPDRRLELNYPVTVWKHWQRATVVPDPNKQPRPSPMARAKATIVDLKQEVAQLKEANGGNVFTSKDTARDVVRVLRDTFSISKLAEIRRLIGIEINTKTPAKLEPAQTASARKPAACAKTNTTVTDKRPDLSTAPDDAVDSFAAVTSAGIEDGIPDFLRRGLS